MPFLFSHVCDLLQQAADLPLVRRNQPDSVRKLIRDWFDQHRTVIDALVHDGNASAVDGASSAAAILSALLPDLRTDRVFGIQAKSLQRIIARALGLGHSRIAELARWTHPPVDGDVVDLADCVECILLRTSNSLDGPSVFIEDIDTILNGLAAHCRFSSPAIRQIGQAPVSRDSAAVPSTSFIASGATYDKSVLMRDRALGHLYRRLSARDAKWLTRLILKDYRPVVLDQATVFRALHPALPLALRVHSDFVAAVQSLGQGETEGQEQQEGKQASQSGTNSGSSTCLATQLEVPRASSHCPRLGVKVGRQPWAKARSIKHCLAMGKGRRMSCERKLDGEYVQVHVDLSKGRKNCLQLFSKSGKDSTRDRIRLHNCIRASLRIDEDDCSLSTGCILEGEMLAYSEKEDHILDFDAVRKHVTRSGSQIYCDSKKKDRDGEHLMIVYYDVLFIDGESLLQACHAERFRRLQELITCRPGYAELVFCEVIDFGSRMAAEKLRQAFSSCISAHYEGLVLKTESDTYFDFSPDGSVTPEWPYMRCFSIKLKKGYVGQFGEVGDFAVVGARYDAIKAKEYPSDLPGLRWTHFYLGCLKTGHQTARDAQRNEKSRPQFAVTNVVTLAIPQMRTFLSHCRPRVVPVTQNGGTDTQDAPFDLVPLDPGVDGCQGGPTDLFADPPVVDIRCFAFHRQGFGRFWSPRFPSVSKFHFDRTYMDVITFDDLQTVARDESLRKSEAQTDEEVLEDDLVSRHDFAETGHENGEERAHWVTQLKHADSGGIAVDADTSQSSAAVTASPTIENKTSQSTDPPTSQAASRLPDEIAIPIVPVKESSQNSVATDSTTLTAAFARAASDERDSSEQPSLPLLPSSPKLSAERLPFPSPLLNSSSPPAQPLKVPSQQHGAVHDGWSSQTSDSSVGRNSRKHLYTFDASDIFPAISPPQLKRLKSDRIEPGP